MQRRILPPLCLTLGLMLFRTFMHRFFHPTWAKRLRDLCDLEEEDYCNIVDCFLNPVWLVSGALRSSCNSFWDTAGFSLRVCCEISHMKPFMLKGMFDIKVVYLRRIYVITRYGYYLPKPIVSKCLFLPRCIKHT